VEAVNLSPPAIATLPLLTSLTLVKEITLSATDN
jgi:hypothetical protein